MGMGVAATHSASSTKRWLEILWAGTLRHRVMGLTLCTRDDAWRHTCMVKNGNDATSISSRRGFEEWKSDKVAKLARTLHVQPITLET